MAAGQAREPAALIAYDGQEITYDGNGNPLSYRGWTMSWQGGRQLATMTGASSSLGFDYGESGLRLSKTINGVEHKYLWQGSKLVSEYYDGKELEFFYDESGNPYAFSYKASSSATPVTYYYLTNLQGDITGILDSSGTTVAAYTYNAWGKLLSSSGDMASINPLRYRGYYYDAETEFYYVSSRYYDPEIGRFINADSYLSTGQGFLGCNSFTYCLNNPVLYKDFDGYIAGIDDATIAGGIVVCGFLLLASYYLTTPAGQHSINDFVVFIHDIYSDVRRQIISTQDTSIIQAAEGKPTDEREKGHVTSKNPPTEEDGYVAPKGGVKRGKTKDGKTGWVDKNGNVWVPAPTGSATAHGGGHWDVQRPDGKGYANVYPGGGMRPGGGKCQFYPIMFFGSSKIRGGKLS